MRNKYGPNTAAVETFIKQARELMTDQSDDGPRRRQAIIDTYAETNKDRRGEWLAAYENSWRVGRPDNERAYADIRATGGPFESEVAVAIVAGVKIPRAQFDLLVAPARAAGITVDDPHRPGPRVRSIAAEVLEGGTS